MVPEPDERAQLRICDVRHWDSLPAQLPDAGIPPSSIVITYRHTREPFVARQFTAGELTESPMTETHGLGFEGEAPAVIIFWMADVCRRCLEATT